MFCYCYSGAADYTTETNDASDIIEDTDLIDTFCYGSEWIAYKDEKCFKVIRKWATHKEAEDICKEERLQTDLYTPRLVSIKSAAEQEYLTNFVFNNSGVEVNVWIGARRLPENGNEFVWNDGSVIDFTNWVEGSPTEEIVRDCVVMQSRFGRKFSNISDFNLRGINGKWRDVTCKSANYVICQKLQAWSLPMLQQTLLDARKELKDSLDIVTEQLSDTKNKLTNTQNELTNTQNELTNTQNELTNTKNQLTNTQNELTNTQNQLTNTQNELTNTKNQLTDTQNQLTNTQNELTNTKNQLTNTQNQLTNTQNEVHDTTIRLSVAENKIEDSQRNTVPIGFIYTQLPDQPEPVSLWPTIEWTDVSSEYAGLFFRVLGGDSAQFGITQEGNSPRITQLQIEQDKSHSGGLITLSKETWTPWLWSGDNSGRGNARDISFYTSGGEVRPLNKAIKIWKRTK